MCRSFVIVAVFLESSLAGSPVKTSDETQKACGLFSFAKRFGLRMGHVSKRAQIWWSGRGQRCETCIKVQEYKPVNMYKPYCQLFPSIAWDSFHSFSTYRLQLVTSCLVCATGYILEGSLHKASACYLLPAQAKVKAFNSLYRDVSFGDRGCLRCVLHPATVTLSGVSGLLHPGIWPNNRWRPFESGAGWAGWLKVDRMLPVWVLRSFLGNINGGTDKSFIYKLQKKRLNSSELWDSWIDRWTCLAPPIISVCKINHLNCTKGPVGWRSEIIWNSIGISFLICLIQAGFLQHQRTCCESNDWRHDAYEEHAKHQHCTE